MKRTLALFLVLFLMAMLCACGGQTEHSTVRKVSTEGTDVPTSTELLTTQPLPKTAIAIDELAEGTYTGTMSGEEYANSENTIFTTILPADITVTIENGQLTFYCEAITSAYGILLGEKTPQSPDGSLLFSGSLPLQQSGDAVIAEGEVLAQGKGVTLHHIDYVFDYWEVREREGTSPYAFTARISMENGVPIATITLSRSTNSRTATVPLALK